MATTPPSDLTADQRKVLAEMRAFERKFAAHAAKTITLEDERAALYVRARSITPPLTFRVIADTFGVTEAAVMQKLKRHAAKEDQ